MIGFIDRYFMIICDLRELDSCSAPFVETSRENLSNDMADHWFILIRTLDFLSRLSCELIFMGGLMVSSTLAELSVRISAWISVKLWMSVSHYPYNHGYPQ